MSFVWLLFAATTALHFLSDNEADNDLWVHLFLGRRILNEGAIPRYDDLSFTAAGAPWVDHEWLAQVVFAVIYDSTGGAGLWVFKLVTGFLTAALIWQTMRRQGDGTSSSVPVQVFVLVLVLAALSRGFSMRPQIFTYLFVAAMLAWLDGRGGSHGANRGRAEAALVAVWLCAWSNLHGGFVVGIGILGLWAVAPPWSDLASPRGRGDRARQLLLPAVGIAAACLNPYGPALFTYIAGELTVPHPLTEWQPVRFGDPTQWPFWAILAATAVTVPYARLLRESPWRAALVAITAILALRSQRHVPLFAICAAAPLADQLGAAIARSRLPALSAAARTIIASAVLLMAIAQLALAANRLAADRAVVYVADDYPVGAVRYLRDREISGRLALPLDWGAYALWHLAPRIAVSMDGRFATVYSPPVVDENFDFFGRGDDRLIAAHNPDYVLAVTATANVVAPALDRHGYHLVYSDPVASLYSRTAGTPSVAATAASGRIPFP